MIEFAWNISHLFRGSSYRAKGTIGNLSVGGCRIRTTFMIKKDDCLGVLIDIPKYDVPSTCLGRRSGGQVVKTLEWNSSR